MSLFAWRFLRNKLPTKDNLVRRDILHVNDNVCVVDCGSLETSQHLFMGCAVSYNVWHHVRVWLGIDFVAPNTLRNHFVQFTYMAGMPRSTHMFFKVIWLAFVWVLWKDRNNCVFNNMTFDHLALIEKIKLNSFLWLKLNQVLFVYSFHDWWKHPLLWCLCIIGTSDCVFFGCWHLLHILCGVFSPCYYETPF